MPFVYEVLLVLNSSAIINALFVFTVTHGFAAGKMS